MADLLRLVELDAGGRPYGIQNLNVGAQERGGRYLETGTLNFTPAPVQPRTVQKGGRFGGSRHAGETRDNGAVAGTWHQRGDSVDDAVAKLEELLADVHLSDRARLLEFKPESASPTRKSYFEIRGPATFTPRYSYHALNGASMFAVEISVPVAPLVQGPPMRIRDSFDVPPDAVLIETNLVTNPRAAVDLTDIAAAPASGVAVTRLATGAPGGFDTGVTSTGTAVAAVTGVLATFAAGTGVNAHPVVGGRRYAARGTAVIDSISSGAITALNLRIYWFTAAGASASVTNSILQSVANPVVGTEYSFEGFATAPADAAFGVPRFLDTQTNPSSWVARITGVAMFEVDPAETVVPPYFDAWSDRASAAGTPHASTTNLYDRSTLEDYDVLSGAGLLGAGSGGLRQQRTGQKLILHAARGYRYTDAEHTAALRVGANAAETSLFRVILKYLDENNYVYARMSTGSGIHLRQIVDGVDTSISTAASAAAAAGDLVWIRGRFEGDQATAEIWLTAPTPTGTAAGTAALGTVDPRFGAAVAGQPGLFFSASLDADYAVEEYTVRPFVRKALASPAAFDVRGIPGTAPAIVDVDLSIGSAPVFGLIGWAPKPSSPVAGAVAPFGVVDLPDGGSIESVFVSTAVAGMMGPNVARAALTSAGGSARLWIPVDPSTLESGDWEGDTIPLEVYVGLLLPSSAVSPRLAAWLDPVINQPNTRQYATPDGSIGRPLTVPTSGSGWRRFSKVGTLLLDRSSKRLQRIYLELTWGAGSSGNIDLDYGFLLPARRRLTSPTGRANDASYPLLFPFAGATKTIRSDGRGRVRAIGEDRSAAAPSSAMGGTRLEVDPGDNRIAIKLSTQVPDDPTVGNYGENLTDTPTVAFDVTPRWLAIRGS